ncbi:MAG TPA: helicase-related protein [Azospirillaceae bacterium]|nr:helicase-related protein [Azospirillaceae bacterium]
MSPNANVSTMPSAGRVIAVLGPTNTGKTHLAIERMLGHSSGMIGFPLRLLARENYDRIVRLKGAGKVALVTGEEKIVPAGARYFVCTVESMPLDRPVSFLAVDEIQLCADPERGHIFTDRLLRARGMDETMFLGAETIKPLIQKLVPRVEFISRPRFSQLTYAGHKKLTRLPPRSAVVAFSAPEVYAMAELLRRQRGGTAVVLGALSPRTRNAQVALYQEGEVDYLVATDAIGMGLNMDVDHVAFARLTKFDGQAPRRLRSNEVAQIAGRAGRHMTDGTFGTTGEVVEREGALEAEMIDAVENHRFENLKMLMWRNPDLDLHSPQALLRSLDRRPQRPELMRVREADDQLSLEALSRDPEVARLASGRGAVSLLWEVCQIPDFRKVLSDAHTRLLGQIYRHLMAGDRRLPEDWVANHVARLDRVEGDIDALVARIAHIRTWTYISHRPDWLKDPGHWQERSRAIEDRLSDALHERLTQRFIDRRSALLVRSLKGGGDLLAAVSKRGAVLVEGHPVGSLEGFRFIPDEAAHGEDSRALLTAARKALRHEMGRRVRRLEEAGDEAIDLQPDGTLWWTVSEEERAPVARLAAGPSTLTPAIMPLHDAFLEPAQRERVRQRLDLWLTERIAQRLRPLFALRDADLSGTARGLAFQLVEALGGLPRKDVANLIEGLGKADRAALWKLGVRLGPSHVFLANLLKPRAVETRAMLWAVKHALVLPAPVPPPGRVSLPRTDAAPPAFWEAIGYPAAGPRAVRVDMLDRLECDLHAKPEEALAQLVGCSLEELDAVISGLGYRRKVAEDGAVSYRRSKPAKTERHRKGRGAPDSPFAKLREIEFAR